MRTHGVPNFPDPGLHGGMSVNIAPAGSTVTVDGIAFTGPAFQAAEKACNALATSSSSGNPPISHAQKEKMLQFAKCMRHHGFPQWSDPTFPAGGGMMGGNSPYSKNTPGVTHAAKICNQAAPDTTSS
jgi:hypothetical protein